MEKTLNIFYNTTLKHLEGNKCEFSITCFGKKFSAWQKKKTQKPLKEHKETYKIKYVNNHCKKWKFF